MVPYAHFHERADDDDEPDGHDRDDAGRRHDGQRRRAEDNEGDANDEELPGAGTSRSSASTASWSILGPSGRFAAVINSGWPFRRALERAASGR